MNTSFDHRLARAAEHLQKQADELKPGPDRDALLKKVRQINVASHLDEWISSPGLQPPT
jgi:hypothetical protein